MTLNDLLGYNEKTSAASRISNLLHHLTAIPFWPIIPLPTIHRAQHSLSIAPPPTTQHVNIRKFSLLALQPATCYLAPRSAPPRWMGGEHGVSPFWNIYNQRSQESNTLLRVYRNRSICPILWEERRRWKKKRFSRFRGSGHRIDC